MCAVAGSKHADNATGFANRSSSIGDASSFDSELTAFSRLVLASRCQYGRVLLPVEQDHVTSCDLTNRHSETRHPPSPNKHPPKNSSVVISFSNKMKGLNNQLMAINLLLTAVAHLRRNKPTTLLLPYVLSDSYNTTTNSMVPFDMLFDLSAFRNTWRTFSSPNVTIRAVDVGDKLEILRMSVPAFSNIKKQSKRDNPGFWQYRIEAAEKGRFRVAFDSDRGVDASRSMIHWNSALHHDECYYHPFITTIPFSSGVRRLVAPILSKLGSDFIGLHLRLEPFLSNITENWVDKTDFKNHFHSEGAQWSYLKKTFKALGSQYINRLRRKPMLYVASALGPDEFPIRHLELMSGLKIATKHTFSAHWTEFAPTFGREIMGLLEMAVLEESAVFVGLRASTLSAAVVARRKVQNRNYFGDYGTGRPNIYYV